MKLMYFFTYEDHGQKIVRSSGLLIQLLIITIILLPGDVEDAYRMGREG